MLSEPVALGRPPLTPGRPAPHRRAEGGCETRQSQKETDEETEIEMVAEKEVVAQNARKVLQNADEETLLRRTAERKDLSTFPISPR